MKKERSHLVSPANALSGRLKMIEIGIYDKNRLDIS